MTDDLAGGVIGESGPQPYTLKPGEQILPSRMSVFAELDPPYSTIVVDPPWDYGERTIPWRSSTASTAYSLMSTDEIAAMPVDALAAPDAHLYLWAVPALVGDACRVAEGWGFTIDTLLTWCKPGPGLGAGWRGNTEHLVVARRGRFRENPSCANCGGQARGAKRCECGDSAFRLRGEPVVMRRPFQTTSTGSWFTSPRGAHSQKPALFLDLIEQMSPGPYVELFARSPRLGWDSWGHGYETGATA